MSQKASIFRGHFYALIWIILGGLKTPAYRPSFPLTNMIGHDISDHGKGFDAGRKGRTGTGTSLDEACRTGGTLT